MGRVNGTLSFHMTILLLHPKAQLADGYKTLEVRISARAIMGVTVFLDDRFTGRNVNFILSSLTAKLSLSSY